MVNYVTDNVSKLEVYNVVLVSSAVYVAIRVIHTVINGTTLIAKLKAVGVEFAMFRKI